MPPGPLGGHILIKKGPDGHPKSKNTFFSSLPVAGKLVLVGYRRLTAYRKAYRAQVPYRLPLG